VSGLAVRGKSRLQQLALRWLPTLEWNVAADENRARLERLLFEGARNPLVLNLGGKHGGAMAASLRHDPRMRCIEADFTFSSAARVICDPAALPFRSETFDAVLADAILEHLLDTDAVTAEIQRVLADGGLVYSDVAFLLAVHAGRYDFVRFTALGHRHLFRGFDEIAGGVSIGPGSALAHSVQSFLLTLTASRRARFAVKTLCRLTLFWLKYLDVVIAKWPGASDAALGTYFVGRKTARTRSRAELLGEYRGTTPDVYERRVTR
jgi:SAM-dependent methyltransferase